MGATGAHFDTDVCGTQGRGIVDPIASHGDDVATGLSGRISWSFCCGIMRSNTLTVRIRRASCSSLVAASVLRQKLVALMG